MTNSTYTAGYSLVETLVAIAILLLAIVGPMTIAAKGIQTGIFVADQTSAIFLAQEQIESVVAIRNEYGLNAVLNGQDAWAWTTDATFSSCFTTSGCSITWNSSGSTFYEVDACTLNGNTNCLLRFTTGSSDRSRYQVDAGDATMFYRTLELRNINANEVEAISTVRWNANIFGGERQVVLRSSFFNLFDF